MQYDSEKGTWGGFIIDPLKSIKELTPELENNLLTIQQRVSDVGGTHLLTFEEAIKGLDTLTKRQKRAFKEFYDGWDGSADQLENYIKKLKTAELQTSTFSKITKGAKNVLRSFGAALGSMAFNMAIGVALNAVVEGISKVASSIEDAREAADEAMESLEEFNKTAATDFKRMTELSEKYEKLSKGVSATGNNISLTNDEYTEYKSIIAEIAQALPNLTVQYNAQGEAISFAEGKLTSLTKAYQDYQKEMARSFINGTSENGGIDEIVNNFQNQSSWTSGNNDGATSYFKQAWEWGKATYLQHFTDNSELLSTREIITELNSLLKMSKGEVIDYMSSWTSFGATALEDIFGFDEDEMKEMTSEEIRNVISTTLNQYEGTLNEAYNQLRAGIQQYIKSEDNFWNLEETDQNNVLNFISSLPNQVLDSLGVLDENEEIVKSKLDNFAQIIVNSMNDESFKKVFDKALNFDINMFNFDGKLTDETAIQQQVDELYSIIVEKLGLPKDQIDKMFGLQDLVDSYSNTINAIDDIIATNDVDYNKDGLLEYLKQRNIDTIEELNNFITYLRTHNGDYQAALKDYLSANVSGSSTQDIFKLEDATGARNKFGKLYDKIDKLQSAYSTYSQAIDEYNSVGSISIDNLQSIISLGDDWIKYLDTSNGKLKLNKEALQEVAKEKLALMRNEALNNILTNIENLGDQKSIEDYIKSTQELTSAYDDQTMAILKNIQVKISQKYNDGIIADEATALNLLEVAMSQATDVVNLFSKTNLGLSDTTTEVSNAFDKLADKYEKQIDLISRAIDKIKAMIEEQEQIDGVVSPKFYEALIEQEKSRLSLLEEEKKALEEQLDASVANGIAIGSDEWEKMAQAVDNVDVEIINAVKSISEFNEEIRELDDKQFQRVIDAFDEIDSELQNFLSLAEDEDIVNADGSLTKLAITQLGLLGQRYIINQQKIAKYKEEIAELNEEYKKGTINQSDYAAEMSELNKSYQDATQTTKELMEAVLKYREKAVEKEIECINKAKDSYEEYIEAKKKALQDTEDENDYQKDVADKQKEIQKLNNQINALSGTDDYSLNKKAELIQERTKLLEELDEIQHDHTVDKQLEMYDQDLENYQAYCEDKITKLEESVEPTYENMKKWFNEYMVYVSENSNSYLNGLNELCNKYGISASAYLTEPWVNGQNALGVYDGIFTSKTGSFNTRLVEIENQIYANGTAADITAQDLMDMFDVESTNLNDDLSKMQSYLSTAASDANSLSDILGNISLSKDFSKDIESLTKLLSDVNDVSVDLTKRFPYLFNDEDKNENYNSRGMNYFIDNFGSNTEEIKIELEPLSEAGGPLIRLIKTSKGGSMLGKFAKGGIIGKNEDFLSSIANSIGEDAAVFVRHGEGILTPIETENYKQLGKLAPDLIDILSPLVNTYTPTVPQYNSHSINSSININSPLIQTVGNVGDPEIAKMKKIIKKELDNLSYNNGLSIARNMGIK